MQPSSPGRRAFLRGALAAVASAALARTLSACSSAEPPPGLTEVGPFGLVKRVGGAWQIKSDGDPRHPTGHFPNANNPLAVSPQNLVFRCTTSPVALAAPIPLELLVRPDESFQTAASRFPPGVFSEAERRVGYEFGVGLNGIPFNPNGPWYRSDPSLGWQFHPMNEQAHLLLGLDDNNAHPKTAGQYHYHGVPHGLIAALRAAGARRDTLLLGFAADGFPIYYDERVDSSYALKKGARPAGAPPGDYDGTFTQDYEFVGKRQADSLDELNGRFGPTHEFESGIYHYFITASFPQIPRAFRGLPDVSFTEAGRGSGCSPLPDTLWAFGGISSDEVKRLQQNNRCNADPVRPDPTR